MEHSPRITQIRDKIENNLLYLLILITLIQTVYPMTVDNFAALILYQMLYASLIVVSFIVTHENRAIQRIVVLAGIAWLIFGVIFAFNQRAASANVAAYLSISVLQLSVVFVLIQYIFTVERVTTNVLYAACAVYLLLGAIFVPIYGLLETAAWSAGGHAFVDNAATLAQQQPIAWQTFVYYSYATLTTLGYGDVLPVSAWARSAASLEALIGVLYLTVVVARLVGLYAAEGNG